MHYGVPSERVSGRIEDERCTRFGVMLHITITRTAAMCAPSRCCALCRKEIPAHEIYGTGKLYSSSSFKHPENYGLFVFCMCVKRDAIFRGKESGKIGRVRSGNEIDFFHRYNPSAGHLRVNLKKIVTVSVTSKEISMLHVFEIVIGFVCILTDFCGLELISYNFITLNLKKLITDMG